MCVCLYFFNYRRSLLTKCFYWALWFHSCIVKIERKSVDSNSIFFIDLMCSSIVFCLFFSLFLSYIRPQAAVRSVILIYSIYTCYRAIIICVFAPILEVATTMACHHFFFDSTTNRATNSVFINWPSNVFVPLRNGVLGVLDRLCTQVHCGIEKNRFNMRSICAV